MADDRRPPTPDAAQPAPELADQPLEVFADAAAPPAAPVGSWSCQWCARPIPMGATACPVCGGSAGTRGVPVETPPDPTAELLDYFGSPASAGSQLASVAITAQGLMGDVVGRREVYQEYFEESLRRQAWEATHPELAAEPAEPERPAACRWCQTPVSDEDVFCPGCGSRLPPKPVADAAPEAARCEWCQAEVAPEATRCHACGGTIGDRGKQVSGLTELSAVEKAAAYAFEQDRPLRAPVWGWGGNIHLAKTAGKALFGRRKP